MNNKITVTCPAGCEQAANSELSLLGLAVQDVRRGALTCQADIEAAYTICLWSRTASRVLWHVTGQRVDNYDSLYRAMIDVDWATHIGEDATISVQVAGSHETLTNTQYVKYRCKDAIVDQLATRIGKRPTVSVNQPDVPIHVHLNKHTVDVAIDLAGESLHRRGYRQQSGEAPLKENLAAAVLLLAGWTTEHTWPCLLDPLCGSGTLLIEAADIAADVAPGLRRRYFGFMGWQRHEPETFSRLLASAKTRRQHGLERELPAFIGYDADKAVINLAQQNILAAGWNKRIHVERRDLSRMSQATVKLPKAKGLVVTNPPYGERLGEAAWIHRLYEAMGRQFKAFLPGWRLGVLGGHNELLDALRMEADDNFKLANGSLPCYLRVYHQVPAASSPTGYEGSGVLRPIADSAGMPAIALANRIRKNYKRLQNWMVENGVSCYRVYDADIPEYNLAVDIYESRIYVQEYAPPKSIEEQVATKRFNDAIATIKLLFDVPSRQVFTRVRRRQKGKQQYQKQSNRGMTIEVSEEDARFLVNLTDYLDTGLFLDHRPIRNWLRQHAQGARFLNLFSYTGSATIHVALGGAKSTVSVDSSARYCDWAKSNIALNGLSLHDHRVIQADCREWLNKTQQQFDLIFLDPPTFSNSKRSPDTLDIQRDHVDLVRLCMKRLEAGGILVFSNNYRRFELDRVALSQYQIRDISDFSTPPDFKRRSTLIHHCFIIQSQASEAVQEG